MTWRYLGNGEPATIDNYELHGRLEDIESAITLHSVQVSFPIVQTFLVVIIQKIRHKLRGGGSVNSWPSVDMTRYLSTPNMAKNCE